MLLLPGTRGRRGDGGSPCLGVGAEVVLEPLLLPRPSHQSLPMAGSFLPRTLLLEISVLCPYVVALQAWHPSPGPASPGLVTHTTQPEQTLPYKPDPGSEKLSPKRKRLIKLVVEVSFLDSKKKKIVCVYICMSISFVEVYI